MIILKQSTAFTWKAGPFVDDTDGKTAKTSLSIAQADIRISKNGGDYAQSHNSAGATHDELGEYDVPLDTTDTNTLGIMKIIIFKSGALPVWETFLVLPAMVYDSLVSNTDYLQVDATQLLGTNWLTPTVAGTPDVNAKLIGNVSQTGRDIGASVLISPGTGTGQLDVTSGVIKANLVQILGTALTETSGYLAAGFKKLFNVASPVFTLESVNQTGDSYSVATAIKAKTDNLPSNPAAVGSKMDIVDSPSATGLAAVADAILTRNFSQVSYTGTVRCVLTALQKLRNKVSNTGTTQTVYKENDTTESWTSTLTTNSEADPVTAIDPDN